MWRWCVHSRRVRRNYDMARNGANLDTLVRALAAGEMEDLVCYLCAAERWDIVQSLVDDPIYGPEARCEIRIHATMTDHEVDEVFRRSNLPEKLDVIHRMLDKGWPTLYGLMYPWGKVQSTFEGIKQVHDIDDCLTVLADGGCVFRLQVLDAKDFTRFKLVELRPPWWCPHPTVGDEGFVTDPVTAEYDFPFPDFGIEEGDEFDYDKFVEVVREGMARIAARSDRKSGHISDLGNPEEED